MCEIMTYSVHTIQINVLTPAIQEMANELQGMAGEQSILAAAVSQDTG